MQAKENKENKSKNKEVKKQDGDVESTSSLRSAQWVAKKQVEEASRRSKLKNAEERSK